MTITAMVKDFFNKTVDARFRRDTEGRLIFLPWGFGTGRVVPNSEVEARLRRGSLQMMIVLFVVIVPLIAAFNGVYQFRDWAFAGYLAVCTAGGFAAQLYPAWLARGLPHSTERVAYGQAMLQSLDRFGRKFLVFGLVISLLFVAAAVLMLVFGGNDQRIATALSLLIFAPMSLLYAVALRRRGK